MGANAVPLYHDNVRKSQENNFFQTKHLHYHNKFDFGAGGYLSNDTIYSLISKSLPGIIANPEKQILPYCFMS